MAKRNIRATGVFVKKGSGTGLVVPKRILKALGWTEGESVVWKVQGNRMVVEKAKRKAAKPKRKPPAKGS